MKYWPALTTALVASLLVSNPANALTYVKYEILTAGSGVLLHGYGEHQYKNSGFSFMIPLDGPYYRETGSNSIEFLSFIHNLGYYPGNATAEWSSDRLVVTDKSSDHSFTASICAQSAATFNGFNVGSFGTGGCDSTVSLSMQSSRGQSTYYTGKVVELRSYLIESDVQQQLGYLGMGAVPEPATWAMMLVGFGMIAGTVRYRRRSSRVTFA